ncbi:MAG: cytochrome c [Bacteroidia bacterium]|nr:cytochrome c [Bacteroidia bacterium]
MVACDSNPYKTGENLFNNYCANCHMDDGKGLGDLIPTITGTDYMKKNPNSIVCIIRYGLKDTITVEGKTYAEPMLGIPELDDIAITNIANYINYRWPYRSEYLTIADTRKILDTCRAE